MAELTRRSFLVAAGIFGASAAVPIAAHAAPNKRRIKPGAGVGLGRSPLGTSPLGG